MADGTKIEWTEATWNPVTGCSVVSPGCTNCYAMQLAGTRLAHHPSRAGLTRWSGPASSSEAVGQKKGRPKWTGEVRFNEQWLADPLRWKRRRTIFVCAHGDLFHESVPDAWIDRVFAVMALCPQHTFQVLTKRSARMREYFAAQDLGPRLECLFDCFADEHELFDPLARRSDDARALGLSIELGHRWPLPNVWLGVSVEDQQRADERIPDLLATPAAVRWLSCEPLLGPINLNHVKFIDDPQEQGWDSALNGKRWSDWGGPDGNGGDIDGAPKLDWIVAGGESGPGARPMHPDWARSLRDQCAAAGVPFFFKQWGEYRPCTESELKQACGATLVGDRLTGAYMMRVGKKRAGRLLDGVEHSRMPAQ